jgi:hypothetical protein
VTPLRPVSLAYDSADVGFPAPRDARAGGRAPGPKSKSGVRGVSGAASRQYSHLQFCECPLHYPTRRFQGVAPLSRGCSAQAWEANSAESCVLNVRFISSSDSSAGGPEGLNTQAHSEQPGPLKLRPSTRTNLRDDFLRPHEAYGPHKRTGA